MGFKEYLVSLRWNTFDRYPGQGSSIYLHCSASDDGNVHKFVKIKKFNAVSFDFKDIVKGFRHHGKWQFSWLPVESINEKYDELAY